MPASSVGLPFERTYTALAGSSPTSTTASPGARPVASRHLAERAAPQAPAGREHRHGFEDVGLAGAILSEEADEPGTWSQVDSGMVAKVCQGQAGQHLDGLEQARDAAKVTKVTALRVDLVPEGHKGHWSAPLNWLERSQRS